MADVLQLSAVRAGYGETIILEDVSFAVPERGAVAVLGRNGVGKTTLLATIMGHTTFHSGKIVFNSQEVSSSAVYERARAGIGYVPQDRLIFPSLSVEENLTVAGRPGRWTLERVYDLFPRLSERKHHRGNQISGGEQQMLAVGRALARTPRLLLLDELSLGLAPMIVESLLPVVRDYAQKSGCGVLLVEQHVQLALEVADRGYVLSHGEIVLHDRVEALRADRQLLVASYLGEQRLAAGEGSGN